MKLLSLTLSPLLLAAAVYGTLQAVQHPDEAAAIRIWMESARPLPPPPLPAVPAAPAPTSAPPVSDDSELADPFHPQQDALASQPRRAPPGTDEEDDEASPSHTSAPSAASAALAPPTLRLLGTLRRDQHWTAIAELEGATHRLQVGDMLPGGLGQVMAVREEQIDIAHAGNTRTISMASSTGTASPALAPPSATFPAKTSRASRFTARKTKRRLIRPGVTP